MSPSTKTIKEKNKVLGIDPGYGRLGYAVINNKNGRQSLADSGCIETFSDTGYNERLLAIGDGINALIKKHSPDIIAVEKIFFSSNQKTATKIAEVRGVIIFLATKAGIPLSEFTPLEIKCALCGHGRADKQQVQSMVKILLNLATLPKYDDTTDAMAIALTSLAHKALKDYP